MRPPGAHDLIVTKWGARFKGRLFACAIGKGGITASKREGDGATPAGEWRLVGGGWRADRITEPRTALPLAPLGHWDVWSDDTEHVEYNRMSRSLRPLFGHERMRRGDGLYDIVLFSDWNTTPVQSGKGSAIFVHCWKRARKPTAGCVAFKRSDLLWIIARWRPTSRIIVRR